MEAHIHNKLVWITGAGTGMGRALAIRLASQGWKVAISARTRAHLEEVAAQIPDKIFAFPMDVTDHAAVPAAYAAIEAQLGPVSVAILNAGIYKRDNAFNFDAALFEETVNVNLIGTAYCLGAVMEPMLKRQSGRILVVSSVAGYTGLPGAAAYGATKAGLINMCEALYPELRRKNVILSVVNPGFVDTPLTQKNDFPMPFIISENEAADHIIRGLNSHRFEIAFPWMMVWLTKCLACLPAGLRFAITRKLLR